MRYEWLSESAALTIAPEHARSGPGAMVKGRSGRPGLDSSGEERSRRDWKATRLSGYYAELAIRDSDFARKPAGGQKVQIAARNKIVPMP